MTDRKSYSDPSRDTGSKDSGQSSEKSTQPTDRDREKNLGSRHESDSSSRSSEGQGSSDRER